MHIYIYVGLNFLYHCSIDTRDSATVAVICPKFTSSDSVMS